MSGNAYWTRDRILAAFDAWTAEHSRPPGARDWRQGTAAHPASTTVRGVFGNWSGLMTAAGREPRHTGRQPSHWTRATVIEAIYVWAYLHGRLPRSRDWISPGDGRPTVWIAARLFGSWNGALLAAGYEPRYGRRTKHSYRASMSAITKAAA